MKSIGWLDEDSLTPKNEGNIRAIRETLASNQPVIALTVDGNGKLMEENVISKLAVACDI